MGSLTRTNISFRQIWLEMEIGITGGEEDGVDNTGMDQNKLYTQPEQVKKEQLVQVLCETSSVL